MKLTTYILLFLLTVIVTSGYTQEQKKQQNPASTAIDKQKQQRNFYRKTLQVDSTKAEQVSKVQNAYKAAMKLMEADTSLSQDGRRAKIRALMEQKNQQLRQLLTPAQQRKVIPSTELAPAKAEKQPK